MARNYRVDIIGKKFNRLTVIEEDLSIDKRFPNGAKKHYYKCLCDCGNYHIAEKQAITSGHTKSCGCAKIGCRVEGLTGRRFNRLTVIERDIERDLKEIEKVRNGEKTGSNTHWLCRCDCGNIKSVAGFQLKSGHTQSCGCYFSEVISQRNKDLCTETNYYEKENGVVNVYSRNKDDYFTVDECDYDYIKNWFWRKDFKGYWVANVRQDDEFDKNMIRVHQLIAIRKYNKYDNKIYIPEHLNRNKSDNTRSNIILKTIAENARNRSLSKANSSGKTGVSFDKNKGKYVAYIMYNYKHKYLGAYDTYDEAVKVRKDAEIEYGFTCDDVFPEQDFEYIETQK